MTPISEQDYKNWWAEPVGREVKKLLEDSIAQIDAIGLTEALIRDPIDAAIYLGQKTSLAGLLEMDYYELEDFLKSKEQEEEDEDGQSDL